MIKIKLIALIGILFINSPIPTNKVVKSEFEKSKYDECIKVLKKYETYQSKPYILFDEVYIGFGHLIVENEHFTTLSYKEAEKLLKKDFDLQIRYVKFHFKNLPENETLLLAMLSYNIGIGKLLKIENILENYADICYINGKYHAGLQQRRINELNIFNF